MDDHSSIFGGSVFGGAVVVSDPSRPRAIVGFGAPPVNYPVLQPRPGQAYFLRDNQAVQAQFRPLLPTHQIPPGTVPLAPRPGIPGHDYAPGAQVDFRATRIPAGSGYFPGGRVPVDQQFRHPLPITTVRPRAEVIGGPLETYGTGIQRFPPQPHPGYPGIFHRPPYVGANRYNAPHSFGPPDLSGVGGCGCGSADGLGGFRGFSGLVGIGG